VFVAFTYQAYNAHAPYYIVICGRSGFTIFFPNYVINGTIFRKKVFEQKFVILFSLQLLSKIFIILRKIQRYTVCHKCTLGLRVKCLLFGSDINDTSIFKTNFRKNIPTQNFMEICPLGAGSFHGDGRGEADISKVKVSCFGGLEVAFGTQVRGFAPGRSRRIFKSEKILSMPSFGGGSKAVGPMP